jgi:hypothetical protein
MKLQVHHILAIAFALGAPACSKRGAAEKRMRKVGAERLRAEAAVLYKDVFAGAAPTFLTVKQGDWPESFRAMVPLEVGAYPDGFSLTMHRKGNAESGVYVVPLHMEVSPNPGRLAHFERIADGIYWYSFEP